MIHQLHKYSMWLFLFIFACQGQTEKEDMMTNANLSIKQFFESYYEEKLKLFPLEATLAGDNRYNDLLPNNLTQEFKRQTRDFYAKYKKELFKYERTKLLPDDQISYDILLWECEINLEGLEFPLELLPLNQFSSLHLTMGQLAGGSSAQPFKNAQDYDNWLKRLDAFVAWGDTAVANMRQGIKQGLVLPKTLTEKLIPQLEAFGQGPVETHLFYTPIKNFPESVSAADRKRLQEGYSQSIERKIIPLFQRMSNFVKTDYLKASRASSGINALPQGNEMYAYWIKYYTTDHMTADQIFELGQKEVERIGKEMEKVMQEVDFEGDLKSFFDFTRKKKELMPFSKPEEVIANFNKIHEKMKPNLQKLFDLKPKTAFEIRRTESFREASASAEYNQGTLDGSRPGIFYVPIPDVREYNVLSDEDLFLHEAIPGHHYQISLQQENTNLPRFRRTLWYSAFGEGWALYTESLGKELGLYTDPYQYFGMLSAEMHRAIRLVVDAGIHAKGWTREQAIQYSLEHEPRGEASIIAEIERYMAIPAQALSYKVGQLKIIELRKQAEQKMGNKFNIKAFHKLLLESGCLPLSVLEAKVKSWIN
ncbi:MAG: DUF885 domain-containing protein [Microscillaceae bacterium]|nr:DUF885 domain-containing protein [Microscillaceae bacterium]